MRARDIPENRRVKLPEVVNNKNENKLGILRDIVMKEFKKYKGELEKIEEEKRSAGEKEKKIRRGGTLLSRIIEESLNC